MYCHRIHADHGSRITSSIIAVHGLGAYPPRAWSREVINPDGSRRFVHWLLDKDMLPSEIPSARVLTFNYESRWLWEAPRQTTISCATQMLNDIDGLRQKVRQLEWPPIVPLTAVLTLPKEPHTRNRPIIFVGHSFGGIVIEQVIFHQHGSTAISFY